MISLSDKKRDSVAGLWCALALTDLRLKLLPHRFNRKLLLADPLVAGSRLCDEDRKGEILNLAALVRGAARHRFIFNMSCLRQALVLRSRLRARGIQASLVYGARKNAAGFGAHAWVAVGDLNVSGGAPEEAFNVFEAEARSSSSEKEQRP